MTVLQDCFAVLTPNEQIMVESSRWKGIALRNLSADKGTILVVE